MAGHHCRVCGFDNGFPIWGNTGTDTTWEICPCCGTEFGYEDCTPDAARANRERWLKGGAVWFKAVEKPPGWWVEDQLKNVPDEYW